MVFQGSFMVFAPEEVSWVGFSWFLVGFHGFQGGFLVVHGFWLVSVQSCVLSEVIGIAWQCTMLAHA